MVWAHIAIVHRERKHICSGCQKAFPTKSKLMRHETKHHGFTCPYCQTDPDSTNTAENFRSQPMKFSNFISLRRHIASAHPKPALQCSVCSKRFARPSQLTEHEQTHTPGGPKLRRKFICPLCPSAPSPTINTSLFSTEDNADICVTAFTAKRNLHAHMRLVHADVVFRCTWPGCPVILSTKQKLSQHIQRHEANRPVAQTSRSRRRNSQGQKVLPSKLLLKLSEASRQLGKHMDETDETASQSSIVALLADSGDEWSAQ